MKPPTVDFRQLLTALRCDANLIRDSAFSGAREAANRMLTLIDGALSSKPRTEGQGPARLDVMPTGLLLRELGRRIRANRGAKKICSQCKSRQVRALGLCVRCYKKAYRKGEISNARR